jgi:hypothetical protein
MYLFVLHFGNQKWDDFRDKGLGISGLGFGMVFGEGWSKGRYVSTV